MKELIKYELKKIFSQKIVWALMAIIVLFTITNYSSINKNDIAVDKDISSRYEGILDDEKVQAMLQEFQPTQEELDRYKIGVQHITLNFMQSAVHARFANADGSWNGKTVEDVYGKEEIQVGYNKGWFDLSHFFVRIFIVISILAIIITAPMYTKEYEGMDNLLLTSKYGKTKLSTAKNIASIMSILLISIFVVILNFIITFSIYGTAGLDSSTLFCAFDEINFMTINLTCGKMLILQIILSISGLLMLSSISLIISSKSKNMIASIVISMLLIFLPLFAVISENNPLFKILGLMPIYQIQFTSILSLNSMLYYIIVISISCLMIILGFLLTKNNFKNHQVS